jgi:hypothetical protein
MKRVPLSFRRLGTLAAMTFRGLLHQKIISLFFFLLMLLLAMGSLLLTVSFQERTLLLQEMFLGLFSLFLSLVAMVASASLLFLSGEEVLILSRAVPKFEYFLGKLLGVVVFLLMATCCFGLLLILFENTWNIFFVGPLFFMALVGAFMKASLMAAMTLFLSTIASSSLFTIVAALAFYLMGHVEASAQQLCTQLALVHGWVEHVIQTFLYLIPDLSLFTMSEYGRVNITEGISYVLSITKLGLLYFMIYAVLGCFLFERRERTDS